MRVFIIFQILLVSLSGIAQTYCLEDICSGEYGIFVTVDICCNTVDEFTFSIDSNQPGFPISIDVGPQHVETSMATSNCSEITYYHLGCFDPNFSYQVTAMEPELNQSNITYHDFFLFHANLYNIEYFEEECDILASDLDQDGQTTFNDYILGYFPFLYIMEDLQHPWFWDYSDLQKNDSIMLLGLVGGEIGEFDCKKDQIWEFVDKDKCNSITRETCFSSFEFKYYDEIYTFCLGDTVMINNLFEPVNQVYTIEYYGIDFPSVGSELSINGDTINMVLDEVEEGCICVEYRVPNLPNVLDIDMFVCKLVKVVEEIKLDIEVTITNSSNHILCQGESIELFDNTLGSSTPEWHLSTGETFTSDTINISFADPGEYSVILSDNSNCDCFESDTLVITVIERANEWVDLRVCSGNTISYEGQDYLEDDLDTLHLLNAMGCDSLVYIAVSEYDEIEIDYQLSPTCSESDIGSITINTSSQIDLTYILDGISVDSSLISSINLNAGDHTLEVVDLNNCSRVYDFEIEEILEPEIQLNTLQACFADSTGSLILDNLTSYPILTSLNVASLNTYVEQFDGLPTGEYSLYVQDTLGCVFEYLFEITSHNSPSFGIEIEDACAGVANGGIVISVQSGDPRFSLDASENFTKALVFDSLPSGDHMLYILSEFDCLDSLMFTVNEHSIVELALDTESTCADQNNGALLLDGIELFDSLYIDNASAPLLEELDGFVEGDYTLLVIDKNGCSQNIAFSIEPYPELSIDWPEIFTDCSTTQVLITPTVNSYVGDLEYIWSNGSTNDEILVTDSGNYSVTISDQCSELSHSWELDFVQRIGENSIFIPNIVMPTGISPNNCFSSILPEEIELISFNLTICDPWGNQVFESSDHLDCWDGMFNGQYVQSGVYLYINRITYLDCEVVREIDKIGDVTVVY